MKHKIFYSLALAFVGLTFTSCSVKEDRMHCLVPVTVHLNNISVSMEEFSDTRAVQDVEDYDGIKAIDLAFYEGNTEVFKTTQIRSDGTTYTTFGEFECALPIGNYTLVAIARGYSEGDVFTLTSPTSAAFTSERARETFCATQAVTVTSDDPLDLSVTLNRIIARLNILSTDVHSASVTRIRTTYAAGGKSFNPSTGLATVNSGFTVTNSGFWEQDGTLHVSNYAFLATDEQTMDITLEALDADDHVLFSKLVPNVPLKRNRVTTLSGAMFTTDASMLGFQVETDWLEGNTVNY